MSDIDEIAKKIALEHAKPLSALDRIAEEAVRRHLETQRAFDTHAARAALEAIHNSFSDFKYSKQFLETINAVQGSLSRVSQDIIHGSLVAQKALEAIAWTHQDTFLKSAELVASAAVNSVARFQESFQPHLLASLRSSFERDFSPMLAAIETMRGLGLERLSPEFSEYISETLEEVEESKEQELPKTTAEVVETATKVFEAKAKGLSPDRQFKLMLALTVLSILISLYQAIEAGKPIRIDPIQLEQLKAHPDVTVNIYNIFAQINEHVEYQVERKVQLKLKPKNCSTTMVTLEVGEKVKLIRMSHKWIYVEYHDEEEDLPIYGWSNKKYLKRVK